MKTELKAKFLQHLIDKKKGDEGFTLIELLVVIIIIGILAAIALPAFLNQANKARVSEAQTYASSYNRGQQAYFVENGTFTTLANLGIGVTLAKMNETGNFTYTEAAGTSAATLSAAALKNGLVGVTGVVNMTGSGNTATTVAKVCTATTGQAAPTCTP